MTAVAEFLEEEIAAGSFPGAVALLGSAGAVEEVAHAGFAAVEPERRPLAEDTPFDLASLTKPLATGALVRAAGPGLPLDSAPGRYLPEWKRTRFDGITLAHLLTHTSGLAAWQPLYVFGEGAPAYRRTLAGTEPEAAPGERLIYSDLNFLLLTDVLEVFFAAPIDRLFRDLVAAPAGSSARFLPDYAPAATLPAATQARLAAATTQARLAAATTQARLAAATTQARLAAATERDDRFERAMTEARGLRYDRFRTGVVCGEVHDGNAFRRGGVAGNAGLFGTARDVWALARAWLELDARRFAADRTGALDAGRGLAWQGWRGAGSAVAEMSPSSFGHTGFTGTSLWIDPDRDRIAVLLTNRIHPEVREIPFNEVRQRFHRIAFAPRG